MFKKFIHYLQSLRCKHTWEIYDMYTAAVFTDYQYLFNIMPNRPEYKVKKIILRCSECGDMKEKEFKI
jgi:hypothetical protein